MKISLQRQLWWGYRSHCKLAAVVNAQLAIGTPMVSPFTAEEAHSRGVPCAVVSSRPIPLPPGGSGHRSCHGKPRLGTGAKFENEHVNLPVHISGNKETNPNKNSTTNPPRPPPPALSLGFFVSLCISCRFLSFSLPFFSLSFSPSLLPLSLFFTLSLFLFPRFPFLFLFLSFSFSFSSSFSFSFSSSFSVSLFLSLSLTFSLSFSFSLPLSFLSCCFLVFFFVLSLSLFCFFSFLFHLSLSLSPSFSFLLSFSPSLSLSPSLSFPFFLSLSFPFFLFLSSSVFFLSSSLSFIVFFSSLSLFLFLSLFPFPSLSGLCSHWCGGRRAQGVFFYKNFGLGIPSLTHLTDYFEDCFLFFVFRSRTWNLLQRFVIPMTSLIGVKLPRCMEGNLS